MTRLPTVYKDVAVASAPSHQQPPSQTLPHSSSTTHISRRRKSTFAMPARSRPSSRSPPSENIPLVSGRTTASDNGSAKVKDNQFWDADRRKDFLHYGTKVFYGILAVIIFYMIFRNPAAHTANTSPATPPIATPLTPSEMEEIIFKILMKRAQAFIGS